MRGFFPLSPLSETLISPKRPVTERAPSSSHITSFRGRTVRIACPLRARGASARGAGNPASLSSLCRRGGPSERKLHRQATRRRQEYPLEGDLDKQTGNSTRSCLLERKEQHHDHHPHLLSLFLPDSMSILGARARWTSPTPIVCMLHPRSAHLHTRQGPPFSRHYITSKGTALWCKSG